MNNHLGKDCRGEMGEMQSLRMPCGSAGGSCLAQSAWQGLGGCDLGSLWRDLQLAQVTNELSAGC